jgi:CheY-like chemotaxis protein
MRDLSGGKGEGSASFSCGRKLKRVMIVDDNKDYADLLRLTLAPLSRQISVYNNGESALSQAATEQPDVILLDIFLLGIHGLYALSRLKADPATAKIPVVILSSLRSNSFKRLALEAGAADVLSKNLPLQEVMNRVLECAPPPAQALPASLN